MDNFIINENTRVIAKSGEYFLLTNDKNATLNDIFVKGVIINKNHNIISPVLPIGTLTKDGYWENLIEKKEEGKKFEI